MIVSLLLVLLQSPDAPATDELTRRLESGEPVAAMIEGVSEDERKLIAWQLEFGALWPADLSELLAVPDVGVGLARRMAVEGLPPGVDLSSMLARFGSDDPRKRALLAAAALVPARVSIGTAVDPELRKRALRIVLDYLLDHEGAENVDILYMRARGVADRETLLELARQLAAGSLVHRARAIGFLLAAAHHEAYEAHRELLASDQMLTGERGRFLESLVFSFGRAEIDRLLPGISLETPEDILRRFVILMQDRIVPSDLELLAEIARAGPGTARAFALQLWARLEENPEQRLEILQLVLDGPDRFLRPGMESLARAGFDAGVADQLLEFLHGANSQQRLIAVSYLPDFMDSDELAGILAAKLEQARNGQESAEWARALAFLPSAVARDEAARWLATGGWQERASLQVVAGLKDYPEIDPYLDALLHDPDVPVDVRFRLGVGRAAESDAAREYLRRIIEEEDGLLRALCIDELAAAGDPQDWLLLLDVLRDRSVNGNARAATVPGLVLHAEFDNELLAVLDGDPSDYEVVDAIVREAIERGSEELRAAVLERVHGETLFEDPELSRGLRHAAWRSQSEQPRASESAELWRQLLRLMQSHPRGQNEDGTISDLRTLGREYAEVGVCARALPPTTVAELPDWGHFALVAIDPAPLWFATQLIIKDSPEIGLALCRHLLGRTELEEGARLRVQASWLRAARLAGDDDEEAAAIEAMLAEPGRLRAYPRDLTLGLSDIASRGWVIARDRLIDRALLAAAKRDPGSVDLGLLLEGFADDSLLVEAAGIALGAGDKDLAVKLARRAVDWAPTSANARRALARTLEEVGDPAAAAAWRWVESSAFSAPPDRDAAREALQRLEGR